MKRIGLFGGTFDPIHNGHLHIARAFADELVLERVIFIPAGDPYHKDSPVTATAQQRMDMTALAAEADERFAVSDCDIVREGATYTVDTVSLFRQAFPQTQIWWLMGMDALMKLHTWRRFRELVRLANFAVAARAGTRLADAPEALRPWLSEAVAKAHTQPQGSEGGRLHVLQAALSDISSTEIRAHCRSGSLNAVHSALPPRVADYIAKHRLYQA